jgi:hypothetical protein
MVKSDRQGYRQPTLPRTNHKVCLVRSEGASGRAPCDGANSQGELGCEPDEKRFQDALRKVAKHKPQPEPTKKGKRA